jgi:hypothetical protein
MPSRLITVGFVMLLTACGGGGGGGGSSSNTELFPGTYRGTVNLTASAGGASVSQSGAAVLVLSPNQTVTVGSFPGSAPVVGNEFTLTVPSSTINGANLNCTQGSIVIDGTFAGTTVTGSVSSGSIVCNGAAVSVTGNYTGTLQAALLSRGASVDLRQDMRNALLRALAGP